jgi:hypothetical protein
VGHAMDDRLSAVATLSVEATAELGPDLGWLVRAVWPRALIRLDEVAPPGFRTAEVFEVIPSASRPRVLVPVHEDALIVAAMRGVNDGIGTLGRRRRVMRSRSAARASGHFPELVVAFPGDPRPLELPTQVLREVLGRPDVQAAYSFGPARATRKPIVQALTLDGQVLAFAKLGWNERIDSLLENEARALRRLALHRPASFASPGLIDQVRWGDGRVMTVVEPIPAGVRAEVRPGTMPPASVVHDIARIGGVAFAPLGTSPFWRRVLDRSRGTTPARRAVSTTLAWLHEIHGRRPIWQGSWHGDFAPRNMLTLGGRLHIWDWERFANGVPLGLDVLHFHFETAYRRDRHVPRAAARAVRRSRPVLASLGVPDDDVELLASCYLAERLLRCEEGDGGPLHRGDLVDELRRWAGRT